MSLVATTLLGCAVGAPLGWIIGDMGVPREPRAGMAYHAVAGATLGLLMGIVQWFKDRRGPREPLTRPPVAPVQREASDEA